MSLIRQRCIYFVQNYQNGVLSVLPNALNTKNTRQYSINARSKPDSNTLLKATQRLINIKHVSNGGIVESPLGPCPPIPNINLVEYIFKNMDQFPEDPALVK